jgi:hypothetical protein
MFVQADHPRSAESPAPPAVTTTPEVDVANLPLERLEHEIETLAAHINAGSCRWLELVAEFDRREGWGSWGIQSCAHWISWRCAIAPRAAREHVRVARCLPELPLIREAFRGGELSYSKVRALTRVASADSEEDLMHLARHATAAQLDRIVRGYRRVTTEEADLTHERSYVNWHWDEDGSLRLNGRIPAEDGALFLRALEAAQDALHERRRADKEPGADPERSETDSGSAEPHGSNPHRNGESGSAEPSAPSRPTHAEAFAALAESALARGPTAIPGGDRYQVVIHADATALTRDDAKGRCQLDDGPSVSAETARRAACDSALVSLVERNGEPLSVGRRTRSIPPALRRALAFRDRSCQFPGCERHRFTDAHHVKHWVQGGETSLDNLILLCRHHHRLVHEGGFSIARSADGEISVRHPGGWRIPVVPRPRPSDPSRLAAETRRAGIAIDHETCVNGHGERMNLAACVDAVFAAVETAGRG